MKHRGRTLVSISALLIGASCASAREAQLAAEGRAWMPVVVATNASDGCRKVAEQLSKILARMAGAEFAVTHGDGRTGIAVGRAADFPALKLAREFDANDIARREEYLLRSHATGVLVAGATDTAVEDAVWDLLHRLGYRQFFPGERWEIVPGLRDLRVEVDVREHPDYLARRIWYGFGGWDYAEEPYEDWCMKNRARSGMQLNTGHAYDGILAANKAEFAAHPEYLGLVGGERTSSKFCISNPGLRQLVVADALLKFAKTPGQDSVSVDPSDGGHWCECESCVKMGSVSDRALTLANDVAAAVQEKYPGRLVGMYAYNYHSPPPGLRAHPNVVISVATAFLKGGMPLDEIISGWSAKGAQLGIREYYSVNVWDRDLPAAARGGNIAYLKRTIPEFHAQGARFMSAESSDNWGPNGLGYYLAARMLWDVGEAKRADVLVDDFLTRAFGAAKEPMRAFYAQLDGSLPHPVFSDQLGRMFRALDEARRCTDAPDVRARLDDLALYARYVDLYHRYAVANGPVRQQAFETLIRHAYRMRKTMLIHAKALYRDLAMRDKTVRIPDGASWNVPEGKNPWKSSEPFAADEIARFIAEGIQRHPLATMDFKPVEFGGDLVRADALKPPDVPAGQLGAARGRRDFLTHVESVPATIELQLTGGLIAHYRDRGNVRVAVWKIGGASATGERETLVAEDRSVPPDGTEHVVKLAVKETGLYRIAIDDGQDRTLVKWATNTPMTVKSSAAEPMNATYTDYWMMYFYVPKGTKVVGFFGGEHGEIRDAHDRPLFWLNGRAPNFYSVSVPDGEDGAFWRVKYGRGSIHLLTVPPYFARSPAELLLPAGVVEADGGSTGARDEASR